jgi:hypothetical protein
VMRERKGRNSGGSLGDPEALVDNVMNFRITVVNRARFLGRRACVNAPSTLPSFSCTIRFGGMKFKAEDQELHRRSERK